MIQEMRCWLPYSLKQSCTWARRHSSDLEISKLQYTQLCVTSTKVIQHSPRKSVALKAVSSHKHIAIRQHLDQNSIKGLKNRWKIPTLNLQVVHRCDAASWGRTMIGPKKITTSPRSTQRVANCFEPMKRTEKQQTLHSLAIEKWSRVNAMLKDMPAKGPRKRPDQECKPHFHQCLPYETNKLFHKLTYHS